MLIHNILITDIADEGRGAGRYENKMVFVEGAIPGDVVDAEVYKNKKKFSLARIAVLKKESTYRLHPRCIHFGVCGGCKWQHFDYGQQLFFKQKQVVDALTRIGRVQDFEMLPIEGCKEIFGYRNRLDYAFSNKKWLSREDFESKKGWNEPAVGFHLPSMFDKVLDVEECHLMPALNNEIRSSIKNFALENGFSFYDYRQQEGFLRSLILRCNRAGEWMALVVFGQNENSKILMLMEFLKDKFPGLRSLFYVINTKRNDTIYDLETIRFSGEPFLTETIGGLQFRVSPKSFFQTNPAQAEKLYEIAMQFSQLSGIEKVYDLYSGTGTIACFIARKSKHVIGIESVEDAVRDACANAALNQISNIDFHTGDMAELLTPSFFNQHGIPDVVIADPPRSGMHPKVVERLNECGANRLVYVSCNPATQARDVELLSASYRLVKAQAVDMFPHTSHIENVALLEKK